MQQNRRFAPAGIVFMDQRSSWKYAYVVSFTLSLRDDLFAFEIFHTLLEAKLMAEDNRQQYNVCRTHSSLGYLTPVQFALQ